MSDAGTVLKSPLHSAHEKLNARLVEFAGWCMPVFYKSIIEEHHAVRKAAGLFDISHMGEFRAKGPGATAWLNTLFTNDTRKLKPGGGQYTLMLKEDGGVIDDLIIYLLEPDHFYLVVNASMIAPDLEWLMTHKPEGITLTNESDETAAVALQGPVALDIFKEAFPQVATIPMRNQIVTFTYEGQSAYAARTGYTGEDGLEIFVPVALGIQLWEHILTVGKNRGILPIGLGARDTLRLEACLPLNGHDLGPKIMPLHAGLEKFVCFTKPEKFIGQYQLEMERGHGLRYHSVALIMTAGGPPPREHYEVFYMGKRVGEVTSGTLSPTLQKGIGMALIEHDDACAPGTNIEISIRGKNYPAVIQPKPLYKRP